MKHTVFVVSPADASGRRAGLLLGPGAGSPLAERLRSGAATIGEIFTFISAPYFRGKLAYAMAFATPPEGGRGVHVIVPGSGLLPPEAEVDRKGFRAMARVRVDPESPRFVRPLLRDASRLCESLASSDRVVLLGSVATPKYVEPLRRAVGTRLHAPDALVGRGSMSRGSLLLRCAAEGRELDYRSLSATS